MTLGLDRVSPIRQHGHMGQLNTGQVEQTQVTSVELDMNLWKEVKKYCVDHGITLRQAINLSIALFLKANQEVKNDG